MSIHKNIMCSFLVVTSAMICAMEEKLGKSQELKTSQSWEIINKPLEDSSSYNFSLPSLSSLVTSATNTVINYVSPEAKLRKLGWPISNPSAQQELKETLVIYQKVNNAVKDNQFYNGFVEDYTTINNRQGYCQWVLGELPRHPQAVELALFCLKHHKPVMNFFDLTRFVAFVNVEQEKAKKAGAEFSQLTILPEETNQLLDKLFEQTLVVKNYPKETEQHKEEEKKRKEEPYFAEASDFAKASSDKSKSASTDAENKKKKEEKKSSKK